MNPNLPFCLWISLNAYRSRDSFNTLRLWNIDRFTHGNLGEWET